MSDSLILYVAIFVFIMMLTGLALTMWEFRKGQPKREERNAEPVPNGPASLKSADGKPVTPGRDVSRALHA